VHRSFRSTSCFLIVLLAFASDGVLTPDNSVRAQGATAIPRTADGKPDFSGIWQAMTTASWDIQDHAAQKGVPGGPGIVVGNEIPYQPAAMAKKKENYEKRAALDPEAKCYLAGIPRMMYMPFPFQIIQTPRELTMLFEYVHAVRYIFMNGEPHPRGPIEWWQGDARGRWEGDTLVVDLVHFNDQTWFDRAGNFHSEALHLVERYTMISPDHIQYDVTVEDSKVFTRPWNMSLVLYRHKQKNAQLFDYECYAFDLEKYYPYPEMRTPQ
jgi:hypothetical protein